MFGLWYVGLAVDQYNRYVVIFIFKSMQIVRGRMGGSAQRILLIKIVHYLAFSYIYFHSTRYDCNFENW